MKIKKNALAWYMYPEPTGRYYSQTELKNPETVEEIFDYCQILLAIITGRGWWFLLDTYGVNGLLEINNRSGWFSDESREEAIEDLYYYSRLAGYDPELDQFGEYCEESGEFTANPS